jgi:hypothetical protein
MNFLITYILFSWCFGLFFILFSRNVRLTLGSVWSNKLFIFIISPFIFWICIILIIIFYSVMLIIKIFDKLIYGN